MRRLPTTIALASALMAASCVSAPAPALASHSQISIIQDGNLLVSDPGGTLLTFRKLGADMVRVVVQWSKIAPRPTSHHRPSFDASNPAAYPPVNWAIWDAIDRYAQQDGISLDFTLSGGAPLWAESGNPPGGWDPHFAWRPSASEYGKWVHAVAERYSGSYTPPGQSSPLPRISFWSIFNEPNFGEDLGPQAVDGSRISVGPMMYRNLVDAGWSALQQTGHGHDTILIGETAARGATPTRPGPHAPQGRPGNYGQTKPLQFLRTLYCVDSKFRQLRGRAARQVGCPTNGAGSRSFRRQHPGLFHASGFGDHPYPGNLPPNTDGKSDPDFAAFSELPRLGRELDHLQRIYGSGTRLPIYNDEYGYITNPPSRQRLPTTSGSGFYVSQATAAYYLNWAEYLSWRNPRIMSYMQYPLQDPVPNLGPYAGFASGLINVDGTFKPAYEAYRLPLYLPVTSTRAGRSLEVWGDVRPADYAQIDTGGTPQVAQIQFQPDSLGSFVTLNSVTVSGQGYFDLRMQFPSSGTVRLAWTYPASDLLFPPSAAGVTVYSRSVQVTIR